MSKPLVYLDQNILGLQLCGNLRLARRDNIQWVYSKENFAEISRSSLPEQYLAELGRIDSKLLELTLTDDRRIAGTAMLVEGSPEQHCRNYLEAQSEVPVDDTLFDPFLAWLNGGGDEELLRKFPNKLAKQISELIGTAPRTDFQDARLDDLVQQMAERGNDINETREALGIDKGRVGGIAGQDPLREIWKIIGPAYSDLTSDQFFGFDPPEKQGYEVWPLYLGIVGCCAVLDIVGFQAEKKCRRIEKIPNVRSDSSHIAMGAFCSILLSEDKRLARRAHAIYRYKNIGTDVLLLGAATEKSRN